MQFYYNSGIPQRTRRTRDGRNSVNRWVQQRASAGRPRRVMRVCPVNTAMDESLFVPQRSHGRVLVCAGVARWLR